MNKNNKNTNKLNSKQKIFNTVQTSTRHLKPLLELSPDQIAGLKTAASIILSSVAVAGAVAIAAIAPNLIGALGKLHSNFKGNSLTFKKKQQKVIQTFYYLKRQGLIQITQSNKGLIAKLTQKGKEKINTFELKTLCINPPKKWDGKWWLVAADIPTRDYRWAADLFRKKIKAMGFYPLQRTLWIYPYNPTPEINFITSYFGIGKFVTAMEINRPDKQDEEKLKNFFDL